MDPIPAGRNVNYEASPPIPLFSHHVKDKPQKGKAKQSTQAMYANRYASAFAFIQSYTNNIPFSESCTVDVLKYFCTLFGLPKAGKKADLVDCLMSDIQRYVTQYYWAKFDGI